MGNEPSVSDVSGELLNPDVPTQVTYIFKDGRRRRVTMSAAEAEARRGEGADTTSRLRRLAHLVRWGAVIAWLLTAVAGSLVAGYISDRYSDKQRELELEGSLITQISGDSIQLFQKAQEAARATENANQLELTDRAKDRWVLQSGPTAALFEVYYADDPATVTHWYEFQGAMYAWAVLGSCEEPSGRGASVTQVRDYLLEHVGEPNDPAPVVDPWGELASTCTPAADLYQWVGLDLLRGRGALLEDLRDIEPRLD